MPLHTPILAERADDEVRVHPDPLPVRWELDGLVAADGHVIHGTLSARLRALPETTERRMLAEAMMASRQRVSLDDARAHFHDTLRTAAARLIATAPAERWISGFSSPNVPEAGTKTSPLRDALLTAANTLAFASGVEILPPFHLTLDSPSLANARIEQRQQQAIDQRSRRRVEIMQSVLAAGDDPAAAPPLPDAADEDAYIQHVAALIDVEAMRNPRATLHAVCGQMLLSIDARPGELSSPRHLALPEYVGAMRSVQCVRRDNSEHLLLGGQRGLLLMRPAYPSEVVAYVDPTLESAMGFNQAVSWRGQLWACHSAGGLVGWAIDQPDNPCGAIRLRELGAPPRHLTPLDDQRLLFAAGSVLRVLDADGRHEPVSALPSDPLTIHRIEQSLCLIRADGAMEIRDLRTLEVTRILPPQPGLGAAAVFHGAGMPLRLLACDTGRIDCYGESGAVIRSYASGHRDLRGIRAAPAYLAGMSSDRSRAVIWSTRATTPLAELHLAALAQHRIADMAWG